MLRRDAALVDQVGDAVGERAGLAGARSGDDEQWAARDLGRAALVAIQ
jgi:hypothetical protein